jgi:hypothetical protein
MIAAPADAWGPFVADLPSAEQDARRRELRALALTLCGPTHPLTRALTASNPEALEAALQEIGFMPPLQRRRLLATYAALKDTP